MTPSKTPTRALTHSGPFHSDEVFSTAVLLALYPALQVERSRDPVRVSDAVRCPTTVVLDVGGAWEPAMWNFDHHQREFDRHVDGVPRATLGLLWEVLGLAWVRHVMAGVCRPLHSDGAHEEIDATLLAERVERSLVQPIDAADNGVFPQIELLDGRRIEAAVLSRAVSDFVPPGAVSSEQMDGAFLRAVDWARDILYRRTVREIVTLQGISTLNDAWDGSAVLVLDRFVPWQGVTPAAVKFVVWPELNEGGWLVQAASADALSGQSAPAFPTPWAGLRDGALQAVSGIATATFCHRHRFIAGARTANDAVAMAHIAMGA